MESSPSCSTAPPTPLPAPSTAKSGGADDNAKSNSNNSSGSAWEADVTRLGGLILTDVAAPVAATASTLDAVNAVSSTTAAESAMWSTPMPAGGSPAPPPPHQQEQDYPHSPTDKTPPPAESFDSLSTSLTPSPHSSVPGSPSIYYQPIRTRNVAEGSQRGMSEVQPGCSVSSLSANSSATLAALPLRNVPSQAPRSLEMMRAARAVGSVMSPSGAESNSSLHGVTPSGQQRQQHDRRASPLTPCPQHPVSSRSSSQQRMHQHLLHPSLKVSGQPPQTAADLLLAELNPSLLLMVQALRYCRLAEVMCPVVVIGSVKMHAAAAWAALSATWGNSSSVSSASSPGLTAAPTNATVPGCESAPGPLHAISPHTSAAVNAHTSNGHPGGSPTRSNDNNSSGNRSDNSTSSNSATKPESMAFDQSGSHNTSCGALLEGIDEYDGVAIDDEQAKAPGIGKERQQRDTVLLSGDYAGGSAPGSLLPPSVAHTVMGHTSSATPFFDSITLGSTNGANFLPSLTQLSESAAQLINPWPVLYANDIALELLGYHKLEDVMTEDFDNIFRCFVCTPDGGAAAEQNGKLGRSMNCEASGYSNGNINGGNDSDLTATASSNGAFIAAAAAARASGARSPVDAKSSTPLPSLLDDLLRHVGPDWTSANGKHGTNNTASTHPSRLREVHNIDDLFAPRYDNYVFLYSPRTATFYAALAVSSDHVELPMPFEPEAGSTTAAAATVTQHNPYLRLLDYFARWKGSSHHTPATMTATSARSLSTGDAAATSQKQQQQQRRSPTFLDLHTFSFPGRQDGKASLRSSPTATTTTAAPPSLLSPLHAKYLLLYILQRIETCQESQAPTRPSVAKTDETKVTLADGATGRRRLTETFTPPPPPPSQPSQSQQQQQVQASADGAAQTGTSQVSSSAALLGGSVQDDVDAPTPLRRHNQQMLQQQQQQFQSVHPRTSENSSAKLLQSVESFEHTALVEVHFNSPLSSAEWNSSNANDSKSSHGDTNLKTDLPVSKEGPQQQSLFELSYTPFQADFAKPERTSSEYATEVFTGSTAAMAASTPSLHLRAEITGGAAQTSTLRQQRQLSPITRDFGGGDVAEHSATASQARRGQISSSLPLAPPVNALYMSSAPQSSVASLPLNAIYATDTSSPPSRHSSPSERSPSTQSGQPSTAATSTAQLSLAPQPIAAPWRCIQDVRNVEGVAQLAQQMRHTATTASPTSGSPVAAAASSGVNSALATVRPQSPRAIPTTTSGSNHPANAGATSGFWQHRGPCGSLGYSTAAAEPSPASPQSVYSSGFLRRHSSVPSRITGSAESNGGGGGGGGGASRSASQLLCSTAAMTWQRSNEVDQIATKKLADRIRSQRNVVSVATSSRLPETLIFNSVAFMIFVQQVLRFQQRHGVTQVVCMLNVRCKTQLVVDMIPVDRLDETSYSTSRSTEVTSSQITQGTSNTGRATSSITTTVTATSFSATDVAAPAAKTHLSEDSVSVLLKRWMAKMNAFYSEEESRQTYLTYSESAYSGHGSGSNVSGHAGGEHHDHQQLQRDSPLPSRAAVQASSFTMPRCVDGPLRQDSSILSTSETRTSTERTGAAISPPSPAAAAVGTDLLAPLPISPAASVGNVFHSRHSSNSHISEHSSVSRSAHHLRHSHSYSHALCRSSTRSHVHEQEAKRDSGGYLAAGASSKRVGMVAQRATGVKRRSVSSARSSVGSHHLRSAMELIAEAAARVTDGGRNFSRSNSFALSDTRTPPSQAMSLPSHPTHPPTSDFNATPRTPTLSSTAAAAPARPGAAMPTDSMTSHPHDRPHNLVASQETDHNQDAATGKEASLTDTTRNSSSVSNSRSTSSWSTQWVNAQQLQSDTAPSRRGSIFPPPPAPQPPHPSQQQLQQPQTFPPLEWVPKSDYLSSDTQQNLSMCDGDINVSAHTYEAQVRIPFITPQRLELLSQLGNVQLSSFRGLSVFGVNLVNMVTEEAAAAAAQPSPPIIPLQYDIAARKYKKDAGEKSTVLPPFNGDAAVELDQLAPSAQHHKSSANSTRDSEEQHTTTPAAAAAATAPATVAWEEKGREASEGGTGLLLLPTPQAELNQRRLSPPALSSPGKATVLNRNLVIPTHSLFPDTTAVASVSATEEPTHDKATAVMASSASAARVSKSPTEVRGTPDVPSNQSPSFVSLFAPDHNLHPYRSPTADAAGGELLTVHQQRSQRSQHSASAMRSAVIEKGSVVSVVMTPNGAAATVPMLTEKQKRRASLLSMAAADESDDVVKGDSVDGGRVSGTSSFSDDPIAGNASVGAAATSAAGKEATSFVHDADTSRKSPQTSISGSRLLGRFGGSADDSGAGPQRKKRTGMKLPKVLTEYAATSPSPPPAAAEAVVPPSAAAAAVDVVAAPWPNEKSAPLPLPVSLSDKTPHTAKTHPQPYSAAMPSQAKEQAMNRAPRSTSTYRDPTANPGAMNRRCTPASSGSYLHPQTSLNNNKKTAVSHSLSRGASSKDTQEEDAFFPEGLPRDGDWLMQSNEQSTSLALVAQTSSPATSLPMGSANKNERSKSSLQHLSMSPPPFLPHPLSVRERNTGSAAVHTIDPRTSPASTSSNTQGLVSVRTHKSGGTELLGYTLSNSAAAALGGFSTALMKEVTLDSDDASAVESAKKGSKSTCRGRETSAERITQGSTSATLQTTGTNATPSPRPHGTTPLDPELYDDASQARSTTPESPPSTSPKSTVVTGIAVLGSSHDGCCRSANLPTKVDITASEVTDTVAVDAPAATAAVAATATTTTSSTVVVEPASSQPAAMAATGGRHGSGSGGSSNSMISFAVGSSTQGEDTRQITAPRDEANDSFAESFMDIFGLTSHPQRLAELRRQVVERVRNARTRSQPNFDNSVSSTTFLNTSPSRSLAAMSNTHAASPTRLNSNTNNNVSYGVSNANSTTFHSYRSHHEAGDVSGTNSSAKVAASGFNAQYGSFSSINDANNAAHDSEVTPSHAAHTEETLRDPQHEIRIVTEEAAEQIMRLNLHVLVYAPRVYAEIEDVLGLYGHCTTFVTNPVKMLRYATAGLQPFDVLIVEWTDSLVTPEIHEMLERHAVDDTVVVYFISTKPGAHTPTMNVDNVMTDATVVMHADDLLTGLLSRNVLEEVQQLIRRRRLLLSMVEMRMQQTYQIVSHIGSGAFGDVFEVLMYVSHGKLAMKRIFLKSMKLRQLEVINREVCILRALEHPNIVSFSHTQLEDNAYSIFMELCDGNLEDYLLEPSTAIPGVAKRQQHRYGQPHFRGPDGLPTGYEGSVMAGISSKLSTSNPGRSGGGTSGDDVHDQDTSNGDSNNMNPNNSLSNPTLTRPQDAVMIVHDIASALVYLHSRGIIHRDIKPANILFSNGMAKLGDFGSAVKMNESRKLRNMKGTMSYMAPEMVLGEPYTEACDLWSFGCLIASIMGIHLGHLSGLHMPALNELYRSIPKNGSLPLTCSNRLSSRFENHYTESTTNRVLAAMKRALANEMEERERTPPPPTAPHAQPMHCATTSPTTSQDSVSLGPEAVDEATQERRRVVAELERADAQNRQRSVMCISTTSIDVLGEFPVLLPASLVELFENLFHRDPSKRMTAADILDHPVSWDVEWMARMMNEVQKIYAQLSLSTMNARASMNTNTRSRSGPIGTSSSSFAATAGSPLRGGGGGGMGSPVGGVVNAEAGNLSHGAEAGYSSSVYGFPPNAAAQPAGYVSYFSSQPGSGGEMGRSDLLNSGEAGVKMPCSANNYVLDLSLSDGSGDDSDAD